MGKKTNTTKKAVSAKPAKRDVITKAALVDDVSDMMDVSKKNAKELVDYVFDTITEALVDNTEVSIDKFGKFGLADRPERAGRNPQSGESITIAAYTAVVFKPSKTLKDKVKEG